MENNNNKKIIFDMPGDVDAADVVDEILKNNNLDEGLEEYFDKFKAEEESKLIVTMDAARVLVEKKVPENTLIDLLVKHLQTTKNIATNIVNDLKEKIIPYAKTINLDEQEQLEKEQQAEYHKENFQEELLDKIRASAPLPAIEPEEELPMPALKKADIADVEKNAENMDREGKNTITKEKKKFIEKPKENKPPQSPSDTYRELVE